MSIHASVGTPTADSYLTVAEANSYFEYRSGVATWDNIASNSTGTLSATAVKERLLRQATREIDNNLRFYGQKYTDTFYNASDYQALQFPRNDMIDANGNVYIPDEVKDATCEQALWILERGGIKTTESGSIVEPEFIGSVSRAYLKKYITRLVTPFGKQPWQGSDF